MTSVSTGWVEGSPIERTSLRPCNPALEFQIFAKRKTHSYRFKGSKVNHKKPAWHSIVYTTGITEIQDAENA